MKYDLNLDWVLKEVKSHPSRGGWIEIVDKLISKYGLLGGPTPHGVGGLKSSHRRDQCGTNRSHPSRGGWIEMRCSRRRSGEETVPPLTGWVD